MQGADLSAAHFPEGTDFGIATLRRACVSYVDFRAIPQIADHLGGMFGDGSVTLPKGVVWPKHWPQEVLHPGDFLLKWRDFQQSIGFDPTT